MLYICIYGPGRSFPGVWDGKKKNLPAIQGTQVQSLGCEDPLEKGMALVEKGIPEERP